MPGATVSRRPPRDCPRPGAPGSGLRREDLAELAGISVDYVVRLEQGRYATPSAQVVAALARALQLTDAERDHLYRLAGLVPPAGGEISDHIPPGLRRVLNRLGDAAVGRVRRGLAADLVEPGLGGVARRPVGDAVGAAQLRPRHLPGRRRRPAPFALAGDLA